MVENSIQIKIPVYICSPCRSNEATMLRSASSSRGTSLCSPVVQSTRTAAYFRGHTRNRRSFRGWNWTWKIPKKYRNINLWHTWLLCEINCRLFAYSHLQNGRREGVLLEAVSCENLPDTDSVIRWSWHEFSAVSSKTVGNKTFNYIMNSQFKWYH